MELYTRGEPPRHDIFLIRIVHGVDGYTIILSVVVVTYCQLYTQNDVFIMSIIYIYIYTQTTDPIAPTCSRQ